MTKPRPALVLLIALLIALISGAPAGAEPLVPDAGLVIRGTLEQKLREIDAAAAAHVAWTSHAVPWSSLEPAPDGYLQPGGPGSERWAALERELAYAKAQGLRTELKINDAPQWASGVDAENDPPTPANLEAYGDLLADIGSRLGPYIDAYSPWNEPNSVLYWNPVDVDAFVALQQTAYRAVKRTDPDATVIAAPIFSLRDGYGFLESAYRGGLRGFADVIGWIGYAHAAPEDRIRPAGLPPNPATLPAHLHLRQLIDRYDPGRPVWLMEFGWSTCASCDQSEENSVSEADQAQYLTRAYNYRRRYLQDSTDVMFWYQIRDSGTQKGRWNNNHGILRNDFSRKPAFAALAALAVDVPTGGGGEPAGTPVGPSVQGGSSAQTVALRSSGLLVPGASASGLPSRAAARGAAVRLGRVVARSKSGSLGVSVPVAVAGGSTILVVDVYRGGGWLQARRFRVTRPQRLAFVIPDRAVAAVRVRATLPGAKGWRVARVVKIPRHRASSRAGSVSIVALSSQAAASELHVRARIAVEGGPTTLELSGLTGRRWTRLARTVVRVSSTARVVVEDRGYVALRLTATAPGRRLWPAARVSLIGGR